MLYLTDPRRQTRARFPETRHAFTLRNPLPVAKIYQARATRLAGKMTLRRDEIRLYVGKNADWASYERLVSP